MSEILRLENVWKIYRQGEFEVTVLKGVNLTISRGELVVVMGPSGSGKTTLLSIMGTLDKPSKGKVYISGVEVTALNENQLAAFRSQRIGFVFQSYNLVRNFTALENVMLPMLLSRMYTVEEARQRAIELLKLVGLKEHVHKYPNQLSGGQQQRVAIARALANDPDMVLMDEPTGNLDVKSAARVISLVKWLNETLDQTFVIVTHNPELVEIASRVVFIRDGRLHESMPQQVLKLKLEEELKKIIHSSDVREAQLKLLKMRALSLKRLASQGLIPATSLKEELNRLERATEKLQSYLSLRA